MTAGSTVRRTNRVVASWRFMTRPRLDRRWDLFVRAAGILAAVGIPIVLLVPGSVPLVWLAVLSVPANSPLSPVIPAAFEPLVMEAAKHAGPLPVTLVALTAYMYMEYLNWHVYGWVLDQRVFERIREHRWVRRSVAAFGRAPAVTVAFFALTPLPFWAVRAVAILGSYPLSRFMVATAIGRFPRLLFYAWVGAVLRIPTWILILVIFGTAGAVIGYKLLRRQPLLVDPVLDGEIEGGTKGR